MDTRHFIPYSLLYTLSPGHSSGITSVSFSSCGRYLASGGEDKALIIWDMATGKKLHHTEVDSPVLCTLWHPSNSSLFYRCQNGRLVILEGFADLVCYWELTRFMIMNVCNTAPRQERRARSSHRSQCFCLRSRRRCHK